MRPGLALGASPCRGCASPSVGQPRLFAQSERRHLGHLVAHALGSRTPLRRADRARSHRRTGSGRKRQRLGGIAIRRREALPTRFRSWEEIPGGSSTSARTLKEGASHGLCGTLHAAPTLWCAPRLNAGSPGSHTTLAAGNGQSFGRKVGGARMTINRTPSASWTLRNPRPSPNVSRSVRFNSASPTR